jgi:hypothetical protein
MSLIEKFTSRFDDEGFAFRDILNTGKTYLAVMVNNNGIEKRFSREDLTGSLTPEQEKARDALKIVMIEEFVKHISDPDNTDMVSSGNCGEFLLRMSMRTGNGYFDYIVDRTDLVHNADLIKGALNAVHAASDNAYVRIATAQNLRVLDNTLNPRGIFRSIATLIFE